MLEKWHCYPRFGLYVAGIVAACGRGSRSRLTTIWSRKSSVGTPRRRARGRVSRGADLARRKRRRSEWSGYWVTRIKAG